MEAMSKSRATARPNTRSNDSTGPSQRQLRVGELIRRTLSEILARGEVHDPDLSRFYFTVGEVRTTPDLKRATIYVLPLGGDKRVEALEALRRNKGEIRRLIGNGMTLKHVPDLKFEIDEVYDRIEATERLFANAHVRQDLDGSRDSDDATPRDEPEEGPKA
jgi:ribosome-binding factor A